MKYIIAISIAIIYTGCASNNININQSLNELNSSFKIVSINIDNQAIKAPGNATLTINKDNIYGNAGCNNYFSNFKMLDDKTIQFSYAGSTRMICNDEKINDFEYRFLNIIEGIFNIEYKDNEIILHNKNAAVVIRN